MAHTFDELVEMQKTADEAHGRVMDLRDTYGRPTATPWSPQQTEAAWQNWRDLAGEVQEAVTAHATEEGTPRYDVEAVVRTKARRPEPEPANA
ncbi:hypothetical protein [Streptomyces sp. NPDC006739]|uniref:hypothetical protein n=1 Tax=Streptomyces sp. NPDC006739 TaxID=3364763 RepID=UPI003686A54F